MKRPEDPLFFLQPFCQVISQTEKNMESITDAQRARDALLAGGVGGAALCVVGMPFDVVKTRLQQTASASTMRTISRIIHVEGMCGLWRGLTPPLLVSVPQFAVVFGAYELSRGFVRRHSSRPPGNLRDTAIAGSLVALPTSFIYTPVDRVKLALQSDGRRLAAGKPAHYDGVLDCIRRLWLAGGAPTFVRGFWATLARDAPAWATYFTVYSWVKQRLRKQDDRLKGDGVLDGSAELSPLANLVAGGFAGAATWAVCVPMDVVKTRFQSEPDLPTYRSACRAIWRASGIGGFFAGFGAIVLGGIPRDAACLAGTEAAQRALTLLRQRQNEAIAPSSPLH